MTARILVVDDETAIADAVAYTLRSEGLTADVVGDGETALRSALAGEYDCVVLDVRLPGLSGLEVCRRLRARSDVPIVVLSAREAEVDRVMGLEAGADDYVVKPFSMAELVSRVRSILRRRELDRAGAGFSVRRLGGLSIDLIRREASVDGHAVHLTPSEFRLLALLASEPGRAFDRRQIMEHLWDSDHVAGARACDIHVSNLRAKIERDPARPARLLTVRGVGYKLVAV